MLTRYNNDKLHLNLPNKVAIGLQFTAILYSPVKFILLLSRGCNDASPEGVFFISTSWKKHSDSYCLKAGFSCQVIEQSLSPTLTLYHQFLSAYIVSYHRSPPSHLPLRWRQCPKCYRLLSASRLMAPLIHSL